jgi:hypothetical protein
MGTAALLARQSYFIGRIQPSNLIGLLLEQLIAEVNWQGWSGIVPVDIEPLTDASAYSQRPAVRVYLRSTVKRIS